MTEDGFFSFVCPSCRTELEVTPDMIGTRTECPACGTNIVVPDPKAPSPAKSVPGDDGIVRHAQDDAAKAKTQALKGRTIRIELGDF